MSSIHQHLAKINNPNPSIFCPYCDNPHIRKHGLATPQRWHCPNCKRSHSDKTRDRIKDLINKNQMDGQQSIAFRAFDRMPSHCPACGSPHQKINCRYTCKKDGRKRNQIQCRTCYHLFTVIV
jgi:transposase-like protein